jgi:L-alanine-DL-glutamate epimerase-like enolase superfamily enzyme
MTETSCGISAAAQLAPLADWVDLDGALLIKNDPFRGVRIEKGRILLPQGFGIGIEQVSEALEFPE